MRYHQIVRQSDRQKLIASIQKAVASTGLKPGLVDDARRAATPYVVDCPDLSLEVLGDREFERQFCERRDWCRSRCPNGHEIEPIRDANGCLAGRRFRFAKDGDATLFKTFFG